MKNLILSLFALVGILFLSNCEHDKKVNVCHKGKIITISVHGLKAHQAHGDAVDKDGDGFFDVDNKCSEVDCDDANPAVYPGAGGSNDCTGIACSITNLEPLNYTCTQPTNTYDLQLRITYTNPPAAGTLDVSIDGVVTPFAIGTSPQTINVFGLPPTDTGVDVIVSFSDDPTCILDVPDLYVAPECGV
jgi:hypothetical protein